jgi:SAM-dependent methyltransferase
MERDERDLQPVRHHATLHENVRVDREDWNARHGEAGLLFGGEPNRFLVAEASGLPPGRALDLACGSGRNAVWLAQQGWSVLGADFSRVALEQARGLAAERGVDAEWVEADLREWEPPPRVFDLVVVLYLHLPAGELRPIMRRAAAAVAAGGTLLVVGHHSDNLESGSGGPKDPRVLFTPEDVAAELAGLEIEKAEAVLRPVEGDRDAIDALVRARRPD